MKKRDKVRNLAASVLSATALGLAVIVGCGSVYAADRSAQTENAAGIQAAEESSQSRSTDTEAADISQGTSSEMFTDRDLEQEADLSDAVTYTVADGEDIVISEEGVYVLTGSAENVTVFVEADPEADAKIQLVLNDLTITNESDPCIYVSEADKVFITLTGENTFAVTGGFAFAEDDGADAVIFAREDLTMNGTGSLTISSTDNGIVSKDDLKITGGTYEITAASKAVTANDSIRIADGIFVLTAGTDGLHAENDEDETLGYLYIGGGDFTIRAGDDAVHANSTATIDGGTFEISAGEGIEATGIVINDGSIYIESSDDGINAAQKVDTFLAYLEINGGDITVVMGSGDTDAIDSNGNLTITGGEINVTAQSPFDCDGQVSFTGGTVIVNGQQVYSIPTQTMGGMMGGFQGGHRGF